MKTFSEELRYAFTDIGPNSTIVNIGGHTGNFARLMCEKYDCHALVFEPMRFYYEQAVKTLAPYKKAQVFQLAIGDQNRDDTFFSKGDMSGKFADGPPESVNVRDVAEMFAEFNLHECQLFECNCEGSEFSILERMLETDLVRRCVHVQIQPHACVPDFEARWAAIERRMEDTHALAYRAPWVWVGWDRK
jgi:FkbM family methyltransferase